MFEEGVSSCKLKMAAPNSAYLYPDTSPTGHFPDRHFPDWTIPRPTLPH